MGYDVFISYSHGGDDLLSERVQDALTRFAKPWYRRRALNVFRDRTALSANPGLWSSIAEAIDNSRYFLFLASPDAASSVWCGREVEHWRDKHGSEGLLVLLTDGEILWDEEMQRLRLGGDDRARCRVRRGVCREEPFHVDMRWARSEVQLDLTDGRFRDQIADLAAPVHGMAKDELASEDVRQHRRAIRQAIAAGVALVVLTIASVVMSCLRRQLGRRGEAERGSSPHRAAQGRCAKGDRLHAEGPRWRKQNGGLADATRAGQAVAQRHREAQHEADQAQRPKTRAGQLLVANGNLNDREHEPDEGQPRVAGSRRCSPRRGSRPAGASS